MRKSNGLLGLIGVILLVFGGVRLALPRAGGMVDNVYVGIHIIAGLLLLIAYLSSGLENLRGFLSERSTKYGTSTLLASIFFIGILTGFNYLSTRHHRRFDLTEAKVYSLAPQSVEVVKNLDKELKFRAFVEGGVDPQLSDLLENYQYASAKVSFEMIDPDRHPELAEQFKITQYNTLHIEYGESTTTVNNPNEESITNAIIKVTRTEQQTVCFIEGHAEPSIDAADDPGGLSQAKAALLNENYNVKKVLLVTQENLPDDCNVFVVAGPQRPYLAQEMDALDRALRAGKRGLFLIPPRRGEEFKEFLARWGVKLGDDVIVDQVLRLFQGPALGLTPLVEEYDPGHEITSELRQRTIFPMTRSVSAETGKQGLKTTELAKTSPSSWAEADLAALFERREARLDDSDRRGPVPVAVAVEANLKDLGVEAGGESRLVVLGSAEFAENRNIDGTFFNRDLFLNSVGWLVGQSDLVSIRTRGLRASRVNFTPQEATLIFYLSVLVIPELLLVAGLVVWWRRE